MYFSFYSLIYFYHNPWIVIRAVRVKTRSTCTNTNTKSPNTFSTYCTILYLVLILSTTSERTTEVNLMCDISLLIRQQFKTNVTIISPTRSEKDEQQLGPQILRNGRIMAFQFKKPISYTSDRNDNHTKFIIKTAQHYDLLKTFKLKEAYYIFVALNNINEIISNRNDFIKYCIALDIHKIPIDITLNQRTRVI